MNVAANKANIRNWIGEAIDDGCVHNMVGVNMHKHHNVSSFPAIRSERQAFLIQPDSVWRMESMLMFANAVIDLTI